MFKGRYTLASSIVALVLVMICQSTAQEISFARRGALEVGGNMSFQRSSYVYEGVKSDVAVSRFSALPYVGYFVADGFELGVNPIGVAFTSIELGTRTVNTTELTFFFAPSYNFAAGGAAYPFIEGLAGYTSISTDETSGGFSWGGRAGVKLALSGRGLLNFGVQYLLLTYNPEGATERTGRNELSVTAGFSVWF